MISLEGMDEVGFRGKICADLYGLIFLYKVGLHLVQGNPTFVI